MIWQKFDQNLLSSYLAKCKQIYHTMHLIENN